MTRQRYELSFDTERDADYIALIEDYRRAGISVMDVVRRALEALAGGEPVERPPQALIEPALVIRAVEALEQLATAQNPTMRREAIPPPGPVIERQPALVETISGGIDMSRPRPTRPKPVAVPQENALDADEFDAEACRQKLIASINAFGKGQGKEA